MSRIAQTFAALKRPALITFITAGDPDFKRSMEILNGLPSAGADIIELGMPFTDPMADGPVITRLIPTPITTPPPIPASSTRANTRASNCRMLPPTR